jgi:hypothetical protein
MNLPAFRFEELAAEPASSVLFPPPELSSLFARFQAWWPG